MIATVEALLVLIVALFGLLLYKLLVRSRWFSAFIGGVLPPAEGLETVDRLKADQADAEQAASFSELQAARAARDAAAIRSELPKKPRTKSAKAK